MTGHPARVALSDLSRASSCTAGYSPCLPPASDYDCFGGEGNGPAFVYQSVRVTGSDPQGLDRNHNGIGCEESA